ncbi:MAG: hypothetical protein AAFN77_04125 [Planctomycetota bacterium]
MKRTDTPTNSTSDQIAGIVLTATAVLMVFAMLHHPIPHAHSVDELVIEVDQIQFVNGLVHGGAIVFAMLMVLGLISFCERLGFHRVSVRAGMISFCVGASALIFASLVSGFIVPTFLDGYEIANPADALTGQRVLSALRSTNISLDVLGVSTISIALALFGFSALFRSPRLWVIGLLGLTSGCVGVGGLFTGHTQATVPGVIAFAVLLGIWLISVGVYLLRRPLPEVKDESSTEPSEMES